MSSAEQETTSPRKESDAINPIHIETTQLERKGTVLMIHGWAQNARVMLHKTMTLSRKLKNAGYDVVFLESPFVLPMTSTLYVDSEHVEVSNGRRKNARAWFVYNEDDPADASEAQSGIPIHYVGLDDSIAAVESCLSNVCESEFCAVFGFSQGGTFAHVLAALVATAGDNEGRHRSLRKISCVICAGAFAAMHLAEPPGSTYNVDLSTPVDLPSLHIIGRKDTSVLPEKSQQLASLFEGREFFYHEKGHLVSQNSASCSAVISFLDKLSMKCA